MVKTSSQKVLRANSYANLRHSKQVRFAFTSYQRRFRQSKMARVYDKDYGRKSTRLS